ncbi:HTH-type transcriptional activator IlvY [Saccharobesus litoralis]|uniref:HTH-type transcriptional activator IlvY n=1 Tax=Saccharobesus litoralis TaxID=2172099 RepID=A0A2S0VR22_9ALTE|nr:HTH-type transcriptional activator IlvY [Saccharobesus litoralis]AWB66663.1 HTH-type transcriptional activator IlvY [Saccharobesus litoralis]
MELKSLQLYLHLADSLHFGKTSEAMHVSPSTLSRTIQRLELEAGVPLFERDNRKVKLTPQGRAYRTFANQTLDAWLQFQQDTQTDQRKLTGELTVFCSVTASYSHLPPILNRLAAKHPEIDINLATGDAASAIHKVSNGEADIAISARPDNLPSNVAFADFDSVPILLIGPDKGCQLSGKLDQADIDWPNLPYIVAEQGLTKFRSDTWFEHMQFKPHVYAKVAGNEAIVSMVALGLGIGFAPEVVIENSPVRDKVRLLNTQVKIDPFALGVCCLQKKLSDPLINAFWQEAQVIT